MRDAIPTITVNYRDAAAVTGYSIDIIKRAVHAGDLPVTAGTVDGQSIRRPVIPYDSLLAWATQAIQKKVS